MKILYYLSKLFPIIGLLYNKIIYRKIHFEIGSFVEITRFGDFKYGNDIRIGQSTRINILKNSNLYMGDNINISRQVYLFPASIKIGNNVNIQDNVRIYGNISIENDVIIAPNVLISSGNHVFNKEKGLTIMEQDKKYKSDNKTIVIEDDCWIGINVVITPGVRIAKGCVIGANSVVTKDTLPYSVYAGTPARKIKNRYEDVHND